MAPQSQTTMRLRVPLALWAFICGLALLICAGCGTATPATPAPTATVIAASPTATATLPPGSRIFAIQTTGSVIHYTVTSTVAGIQVGGTFAVTGHTVTLIPEADGLRLLIDIQIDGNSVTGVNGLIVNALKGSLETDKYPFGYFEATADLPPGSEQSSNPIQATATGTLQLHGQSRTVQMPITLTIIGSTGNAQMVASGSTSLSLSDYGVRVLPLIKNEITFKADLIAQESTGQ